MDTKVKDTALLNDIAKKVRGLSIKTIFEAGSGHIGPALSMVEILTVLLWNRLNWLDFLGKVKGKNPVKQLSFWHNSDLKRDRFIISKGHGVPSWYAALALADFIKESELKELRIINSRLQGHPERKRFPFVDATTGSLGQGQSEAMGYAMANKLLKRKEKVYCIIGDGESNEGQVWETALSAPKFKLDNLVIIVDFNKRQGEGTNKEIMNIEPLEDKWKAFNWHVQRIDGHNINEIVKALGKADKIKGKPSVIIADTLKGHLGKNKLFMNGKHNPVIDEENYKKAIEYLNK